MFVLFHIQNFYYIYSAAGEKLATNANGSLTYYRSVMVYGNDNKLLYILTPEGTVSRTEGSAGTSYTYNYFKKDQIGSTRAVLSAVGNTLQNVQSTDYYPFGLAYSTNNLNKNKYLFSGKELQDASIGGTILGLYDFGARQYDPVIGRWMAQDPANQHASPYIYCSNNPIALIDPSGMKDTSIMIGGQPFTLVTGPDGNFHYSIENYTPPTEESVWNELVENILTSSVLGYYAANVLGKMASPFTLTSLWTNAHDFLKYNLFVDDLRIMVRRQIQNSEKLSYAMATEWYRIGQGEMLNIPLSSIDFSKVHASEVDANGQLKVNLAGKHFSNLNDGLVYGSITLWQQADGSFTAADDKYDFDIHSLDNAHSNQDRKNTLIRNIETVIAGAIAGAGKPFLINFTGSVWLQK